MSGSRRSYDHRHFRTGSPVVAQRPFRSMCSRIAPSPISSHRNAQHRISAVLSDELAHTVRTLAVPTRLTVNGTSGSSRFVSASTPCPLCLRGAFRLLLNLRPRRHGVHGGQEPRRQSGARAQVMPSIPRARAWPDSMPVAGADELAGIQRIGLEVSAKLDRFVWYNPFLCTADRSPARSHVK